MKNTAQLKEFGRHLRRLREEAGMSQQDLADTADIAKITVQRIENAKYSATLDMMVTLAKALKVTLKELVSF